MLAAAALLLLPTGLSAPAARPRDLLDGLIIAGSLLLLAWSTSLGAALQAGDPSRLALGLALAYPLGDLIVVTLVLRVIGRTATGRSAVLALLVAGLLALAVADSCFVYLTSTSGYGSGRLCDLGWFGGFALIAVAAMLSTTSAPPAAAPQACVPSWLRLALPYLPLLLAESVFAVHLLSDSQSPHLPETVLGLGLIVLVLARQFLTLADHRRLLVELRDEREHARHQALHDPLTGLANRTLFHDRLEHALALRRRGAAPASVLFCDVDDFKTVNDGLGHAAGDALLVQLAGRLQACLRSGDTAARLGGDEFAVLLEQGVEPAGQVAGRLVAALSAPLLLEGSPVTVSVSVGLASAVPILDDGLGRRRTAAPGRHRHVHRQGSRQGHQGGLRTSGTLQPADGPTTEVGPGASSGRRRQPSGGRPCRLSGPQRARRWGGDVTWTLVRV